MPVKDTPPGEDSTIEKTENKENENTENTQTTHDWLKLAQEAYSTSTTYFDSSIRSQIESDIRQFNSQHPLGSKYYSDSYKSRSRLFRPKTRAAIRKNEAIAAEALFSTADVVSVSPQDQKNDISMASAEIMKELLQYRLTKSIPWFLVAIGAYQEAQAIGVVCSHQYWEFNEKKKKDRPCIELRPVENIRIDPGAKWYDPVETSPYIIDMIPMYVKDVKARTKKPDPKTREAKWKPVSESQIRAAVSGYSDSTRLTREGPRRQDPQQASSAINDFSIAWVHRNIIEVDGEDWMYYTLSTDVLLSDPKLLSEYYWHGRRPYVMGVSVLEAHKVYPGGIARLAKDSQAAANELQNQRFDNVKFVLNKRYFVRRGANVDTRSLTRNIPGSVTFMDRPGDGEDTRIVETNDVTGSSYQEQDRLNLDFDDVVGTFSGGSVQSNRKLNETVGGLELLNVNANQVSGYQLRTFVETWIEPVLRQMIWLEQKYETDTVILALAAEKSKAFQKLGLDTVTDDLLEQELTLSINVGMGATNPFEQVNQFLTAIKALADVLESGLVERYGMNVGEVIREIFGKVGYKDGGRFFDLEEQDPRLLAMQQTIQELQQALDAKVPPELLSAQVDKAMAEVKRIAAQTVNENVKAIFAAMQSGQVVAALPTVAAPADEILKSSGFEDQNAGAIIAAPSGPAPGVTVRPLFDPRTGIQIPQNTSPTSPALPASPESGAGMGIETARPDSIQ